MTQRAYTVPQYRDRVILVSEARRLYAYTVDRDIPNRIPVEYTLRPVSIQRVPTTVTYCSLCQKEFLGALRVPDEKAAINYVTGVDGYWERHYAKGPFKVFLNGDVWTVRCFTDDGRPLTVNIAKEEGALISYNVGK